MEIFFVLHIFSAAEIYLSFLGTAFPEFHLCHLLFVFSLEFLTCEGRPFLQTEVLTIGDSIQIMKGEMLLRDDLHRLITYEADNTLLCDRLLRAYHRSVTGRRVCYHFPGKIFEFRRESSPPHSDDFVFRHHTYGSLCLGEFKGKFHVVGHLVAPLWLYRNSIPAFPVRIMLAPCPNWMELPPRTLMLTSSWIEERPAPVPRMIAPSV